MRVLFFAQSREAAGRDETLLELAGPIGAAELWDRLVAQFPRLATLRGSTRLARDEAYLSPSEMLQPHDEIAVIPPVSGG